MAPYSLVQSLTMALGRRTDGCCAVLTAKNQIPGNRSPLGRHHPSTGLPGSHTPVETTVLMQMSPFAVPLVQMMHGQRGSVQEKASDLRRLVQNPLHHRVGPRIFRLA